MRRWAVAFERFGPYTVHECLGAGGMATVHRATLDIGSGVIREVALKRLLPQLADDKGFVEDFVREAKLAAQLQHPNIVRMLELGRIGKVYFIAMELVRGVSLLQLMKLMYAARTVAPIGIVIALVTEILDALDYASNCTDAYGEHLELVHRDLSPSNMIVTDQGHVKIIDFGVAKSVSGRFMTASGMVKGKFAYMCPEALAGKTVDRRADIFSIGVVEWELLTGRRLFKGINDYDVIKSVCSAEIVAPSTHNSRCSAELDEIVMHALARDPDERWPSAGVMRRAQDTLRRHYKDGAVEILAWKRSLLPDLVELAEPTAMELSTRDLLFEPSKRSKPPTQTELGPPPLPPVDDDDDRTTFDSIWSVDDGT